MARNVIFVGIFLLSLFLAFSAFAEEDYSGNPSVCDKVGDALWIRPLGFIGTGLKALGYLVSLPVTSALGTKEKAKEFLIEDPYNFYFKRPLGQF
jgi:hypothetical protein